MNSKKAKTATGSIVSGFLNQINQLDGDQMVNTFDYAGKLRKNQRRCACGAIISRSAMLFENGRICTGCQIKKNSLIPLVERHSGTHRRCSFCRTRELADGTIAFVGITACPSCLRDKATAGFRALLNSQRAFCRAQFAGGLR